MPLYQIGPNRWSTRAPDTEDRPRGPYIISDTMEPIEQVDGRFYTSKSRFRKVGREYGLTEVGNEKLPPKTRASDDRAQKEARRQSLKKAYEIVRGV